MNLVEFVGHLHFHRWRQIAFKLREQRADALDQDERVTLWRRLHADENRVLAIEGDAGVGALRRKFDGGDILHSHKTAVLGFDDHPFELVDVGKVGIGRNVGNDEKALGLARGRLEVVGGDRRRNVNRRNAAAGHPFRIEPQPHREGLPAQNVGGGDAVDGGQHRLHHARQIVRDRRSRQHFAGETEIHHRRGLAGGLGHDRIVGFLRNQVFDRVHLGEHFGQCLVRIEVQLDVDLDRAGAEHRGRRHVVDTFGGGDSLFDRRRDEALNEVSRGAGVRRGDVDHGIRQLRILPDWQAGRGLEPDQQDQQAHDHR